jgi:serine/threonine protein kinase
MAKDSIDKQPENPKDSSNDNHFQLPPTPKIIGPYKIETLLERGGMSLLYLGSNPETKEPVTIKVLSPKFLSNPEVIKRFLNEAKIIAMTDHPNIVKLYSYGEWTGGLYIAMEFIQGISLRQYLLQTPLSLKKSIEIILDISYAICHLHTHGVIHRDLKPENILLTEAGTIKLIDFGISQLLTEKLDTPLVMRKRFIGTPIYMSPEQKENPETVSYPSDIYSLGIIAYELILGKLCHGQVHLSLMPKGVQKILAKTLQFKPEDRYHDIVDFISDITSYLNSATLQIDKKPGDKMSELSENLKQAQELLLPRAAPDWPHISIGIVTHKSFSLSGLYCDFFSIQDSSYGIILSESSIKGAEGILQIASLRGMVKALNHLSETPVEFITVLNTILTKETSEHPSFALSYLVLNPKLKRFCFISCQFSQLYHFSIKENKPRLIDITNLSLGIDSHAHFHDISESWTEDNILLIATFSPSFPSISEENKLIKHMINLTLQENHFDPPQKIVERVQRKIQLSPLFELKNRSFILICIKQGF